MRRCANSLCNSAESTVEELFINPERSPIKCPVSNEVRRKLNQETQVRSKKETATAL
jgi:hypothetical protein